MSKKLVYLFLSLTFVLFTSCGSKTEMKKIPGVKGPQFNVQGGKVLMTLTFEKLNADFGASIKIPKLEHSEVTISPLLEGGSMFQLVLDPKDLETDDFKVVPESLLPDGRPFPFTAGGTLPAFAIHTPEFVDATFYASSKLFGIFVPISYKYDVSAFSRIKVNGKQVGIATIIKPNELGEGSGVMIVLTKEALEDTQLQRLIKKSEKNNVLY